MECAMPAFDDAANPSGLPFPTLNVSQVRYTEQNIPFPGLNGANRRKNAIPEPDPQLEEYYFGDPSAWTFDNLWTFNQLDLPEL
jgi:hypothetical protein